MKMIFPCSRRFKLGILIFQADLQTGSQRMSLTNTEPIPYLSPGNALDEVINHEVKELGTHM